MERILLLTSGIPKFDFSDLKDEPLAKFVISKGVRLNKIILSTNDIFDLRLRIKLSNEEGQGEGVEKKITNDFHYKDLGRDGENNKYEIQFFGTNSTWLKKGGYTCFNLEIKNPSHASFIAKVHYEFLD